MFRDLENLNAPCAAEKNQNGGERTEALPASECATKIIRDVTVVTTTHLFQAHGAFVFYEC